MLNAVRRSRLAFAVAVVGCWLLSIGSIWQQFSWQLKIDVDKLPDNPLWLSYLLRVLILYSLLWAWILGTSLTIALFRKHVLAWVLPTAPIALIIPVIVISIIVCCNDPEPLVENVSGEAVPVAIDLESCNILASNEFEPSFASRTSYAQALQKSQIIQLSNGTDVNEGNSLNFDKHHLIPWKSTGPMTYGEEVRNHIGVFLWITPKTDRYKGKSLCVSRSMIRVRRAPL